MAYFGKNIKAIRQNRQITQQQLSDKTGISREQISRYENGSVDSIRTGTIKALCDALDCTEVELMGFDDGYASTIHYELVNSAPTLPEIINMSSTDTNGGKLLDEDWTYPVNSTILKQYPDGVVCRLNSQINKSEIMDFSHAYFYPEHNISDYSDHICLFRYSDNLMCCRVHIFDDNVVMITNDDKTVVSVDDVEFIGRCVWFEHFDRGL